MIHAVVIWLMMSYTLLAFDAQVDGGDVVLMVNEINQTHKAQTKLKFNDGDTVCFVSGEGVLKIKNDTKTLTQENKSCKYFGDFTNTQTNGTSPTRGKMQDAISYRNATSSEIDTTPIAIKATDKYLHIKSKVWSPRTITIKIFDTQGKVVATDANKNNPVTSFIFPTDILKDGYRVKVMDGFDGVLMDSLVVNK